MNAPGRLILIAGPCVIESEKLCLRVASALKKTCDRLGVFFVFKASYDKANRTSAKSFRGPGLEEGLAVLADVRARVGVPVLTDVHTEAQATAAARVADILQIPAFLCRQTDLIAAAVRTGRIVNVKKGQFLSPEEMGQVIQQGRECRWEETSADRARHDLRLPQPGRGHALDPDHAAVWLSGHVRRDPLGPASRRRR